MSNGSLPKLPFYRRTYIKRSVKVNVLLIEFRCSPVVVVVLVDIDASTLVNAVAVVVGEDTTGATLNVGAVETATSVVVSLTNICCDDICCTTGACI